jgi:FPC/CPF motif-containing protein YcgG
MEEVVRSELTAHIRQSTFPCIMAKAVEKTGRISICEIENLRAPASIKKFHDEVSIFIDKFRADNQLSSFILSCDKNYYADFEKFEEDFWVFLKNLREYDRKLYPHDPRVAEDPADKEFSFSIKSEAFFILLLHPESPRWARRFPGPAIVFNAHVQFEKLRIQGVFDKVRTLIRTRDWMLQGTPNPMLSDYGEKSEIFQYVGRNYSSDEEVPLLH